jgi:hypothetical protein
MNITLKNVPDKVYKVVKQAAKRQGRSLNAHIIHTLEAEVAEIERQKRAADWRKRVDEFRNSLPPQEDSTPLIRQQRQRR